MQDQQYILFKQFAAIHKTFIWDRKIAAFSSNVIDIYAKRKVVLDLYGNDLI